MEGPSASSPPLPPPSSSSSTKRRPPQFPPAIFKDFPLEPILSDLVVASYEGDRDDYDRFDGPGVARFRNGDEYTGEFRLGLMNGQGKYTWKDGTVYQGTFVSNQIQGQGKYTWVGGSSYEGSVSRGLRDGHGVFMAAGGWPKYEGAWMEGKRQGRGVLSYDAEGKSRYEGEWYANLRQGQGKMLYLSGNTYEGEWREDKKNGFGVMHWYDRRERYSGHWLGDKQAGFGEHVWMEDRPAEASLGLMKQMCNMYRGEWDGGERSGEGTFFYSNGARYSGQWKANRKDGYGIFIFEDGHLYEGIFTNDRMAEAPTGAGSRKEDVLQLQLYVDVTDILPSVACDVNAEIRKLEKLALQHNTELKKLYKLYSNGSNSSGRPGSGGPSSTASGQAPPSQLENCFTMSIREFKRFCKDCKVFGDLITSITIDRILYKMRRHHFLQAQSILAKRARMSEKPGSTEATAFPKWIPAYDEQVQLQKNREDVLSLLFREFFEALVRVAHFIYTNEAPELPLYAATKRLLQDKVIPYMIVPHQQQQASPLLPTAKATGAAAPDTSDSMDPLKAQQQQGGGMVVDEEALTALYKRYCSSPQQAEFTRRDFLKVIRDCGMLGPEMITLDDVIQALKTLTNQYGRASYIEEACSDFTELDSPMTLDEFREGVNVLADELTKKERLRGITNTSSLHAHDATSSSLPSQGTKATLLLGKIKSLGQSEGGALPVVAKNE